MSRIITLLLFYLPFFLPAQTTPLIQAEQMPYFPGCEDLPDGSPEKRDCSNENLVVFIADYLEYPEAALEAGIEGTVYASFVVNEEGRVQDATLIRDIGGNCGQEALRIVANMPVWEPARQDGKAVAVKMNIPIRFSLKNAEPDPAEGFTIQWGSLDTREVSREELRENLEKPLLVRDELGNPVEVSQLVFAYRKNRRRKIGDSRGSINRELEKVVRRARKGGTFAIRATILKDAEFVEVERFFEVTE